MTDGVLANLYADRIGIPSTRDEVYGYWIFVLGAVLGAVGIGVFLASESATTVREVGIAVAALGLALLIAGPVIRLPLQSWATYLTGAGVLLCVAAVAWFTTIYPQGWFDGPLVGPGASAEPSFQAIVLYGLGILFVAVAAIVVPFVRRSEEDQVPPSIQLERVREERDELREERDTLQRKLANRDDRIGYLEAQVGQTSPTDPDTEEQLAAMLRSQARFELYEDRGGEWRWRLHHYNGNVIADSGEGYASRQKAQQGLHSVKRNAAGAAIRRIAPDDPDPEAMVADTDPIPDPEEESQARFERYEDDAGEWRWRLIHENGHVIADSGEGYFSKPLLNRALESVRRAVEEADYLRVDPTAFELYRDEDGEWRWRLVHRNGEVLADGGQGYASRRGARDGAESVRANAGDADVELVEE